jgi:hypothetical protein
MAYWLSGLLNSSGPITPGKVAEIAQQQAAQIQQGQQAQQAYNSQPSNEFWGGLQGAFGAFGGLGGYGIQESNTQAFVAPTETPVAKQPEPLVEQSKLMDGRSRKIRE